jgi:hypothetical protein
MVRFKQTGDKACYIRGLDNDIIIDEVKKVIESAYPVKEGKIYIPISVLVDHIREHPEKFKILGTIKSDVHIKSIFSDTMREEFGWPRFARRKGNGSVFKRIFIKETTDYGGCCKLKTV